MHFLQICVFVFIISLFNLSRCSELIFSICFVRHGIRNPYGLYEMPIPTEPQYDESKDMKMELTPVGMRQHYLLGTSIYNTYSKNLLSSINIRNETTSVYFRSSPFTRTIMSAQSFLLGIIQGSLASSKSEKNEDGVQMLKQNISSELQKDLLPFQANAKNEIEFWKGYSNLFQNKLQAALPNSEIFLPIHTKLNDSILRIQSPKVCPVMEEFRIKNRKSQELQNLINSIISKSERANILKKIVGEEIFEALFINQTSNISFLNTITDYVIMSQSNGRQIGISKLNQKELSQIDDLSALSMFVDIYGNPTQLRIICTNLFKLIINYFEMAIRRDTHKEGFNNYGMSYHEKIAKIDKSYEDYIRSLNSENVDKLNFVFYSAHDSVLSAILHGIQAENTDYLFKKPKPASAVIFELHKKEDGYFVKIKYNKNNVKSGGIPDVDSIFDHSDFMFDDFKSFLNNRLYSYDLEKACEGDYVSEYEHMVRLFFGNIVVFVLFFVLMILFCVVICFLKKRWQRKYLIQKDENSNTYELSEISEKNQNKVSNV